MKRLQLTVEEPTVVGGVALFPLLSSVVGERPYLSGPTALADGLAVIHELDGGAVPSLVIETHASLPVLLVEGELLVGGRQNRVVNVTVLCPPGLATTVPVSCVEAGRWGAEQPMTHSRHHSPGSFRGQRSGASATSKVSNGAPTKPSFGKRCRDTRFGPTRSHRPTRSKRSTKLFPWTWRRPCSMWNRWRTRLVLHSR